VYLGRLDGFFGGPIAGRSIALGSPVLSAEAFAWVLAQSEVCRLSTVFPVADGAEGAARALDELERAAVEAARAGAQVIVLSDHAETEDGRRKTEDGRSTSASRLPPPACGVDEQHAALPLA